MNTNRRKFLTSTTALTASAAAGSMLRWGVESAEAQAVGGYKAIVCVFLFGGNDSNNMIVPVTDYAQYAATRTVASNVALTQAQLLSFNAPSAGKSYGFHPSFAPLAPTYASGKLAVIANAGTLVTPLTQAQYKNPPVGYVRPSNLFSHSDQQNAWMGQISGQAVATGWGGRAGDTPSITAASAFVDDSRDDLGLGQAGVHHRQQDGAAGHPGQRRCVGVGARRARMQPRDSPRCRRCSVPASPTSLSPVDRTS